MKEISELFPSELRGAVKTLDFEKVREIRLRTSCPVTVCTDRIYFLGDKGLSPRFSDGIIVSAATMEKTLERICQNSVYALQDQLISGFVPLFGGHRAGICGKTVTEKGKITHVTEISSINVRIAHEIKGSADSIMPRITTPHLQNTLIISPPACGKTTLLRDIARQLAGEKYMYRVGIVDERGEIAASYKGVAQSDVGFLSDVYHLCPKAEGIRMLLRSMSPQVVITDEIGTREDGEAVCALTNAGIKIICTAHAYGKEDLLARSETAPLLKSGIFERVVVLSSRMGVGTIEKIY